MVQSKCWTRNHGLINVIRELGGSLKKYNLEHGIFFTSIEANNYEREQATQYGIELWDAVDILAALKDKYSSNPNAINASHTFELSKVLILCLKGIGIFLKFVIIELIVIINEIFSEEEKKKNYKRRFRKARYSY